jgi:hypothetical protein
MNFPVASQGLLSKDFPIILLFLFTVPSSRAYSGIVQVPRKALYFQSSKRIHSFEEELGHQILNVEAVSHSANNMKYVCVNTVIARRETLAWISPINFFRSG